MITVFELPKEDLGEFFNQTSLRMGIGSPHIVEKDYWVVKLLDLLFSDKNFQAHHVFKGGTSLSKCFGLIQRFSEDIDITISRSLLGFQEGNEDVASLGNKKRKRYFEDLSAAASQHVNDIVRGLSHQLGDFIQTLDEWALYVSPDDQQTLVFEYPRALALSMYPDDTYVKPRVLLEFGCRGDIKPATRVGISTYVEQEFSDMFTESQIVVNALTPERTFWEKVTLLHMLAHQKEDKPLQERMARHYYDTYKLATSPVLGEAMKNLSLLKDVAFHKSVYFKSKQASYETAKPGSLKLIPNEVALNLLEKDYKAMTEMFFNEPADFNEVLSGLRKLESFLNIEQGNRS